MFLLKEFRPASFEASARHITDLFIRLCVFDIERQTVLELLCGPSISPPDKSVSSKSSHGEATANSSSSCFDGRVLYSVYIPLAVPLPRSQVWHHVSKNEKGDEEPNLRYVLIWIVV
jgi:hypothetical protein